MTGSGGVLDGGAGSSRRGAAVPQLAAKQREIWSSKDPFNRGAGVCDRKSQMVKEEGIIRFYGTPPSSAVCTTGSLTPRNGARAALRQELGIGRRMFRALCRERLGAQRARHAPPR